MNAITTLTALTIALTAFAASANAQDATLSFEAPAIEAGAAHGVQLGDRFAMDAWVKIDGPGYVVGHPGRASVEVLDGSLVFTLGGDEMIDGIAREAYVVTIPLGTWAGPSHETVISAQFDGETMRLVAYGPGLDAPVVAERDVPAAAAMLEQLSVMEDIMGAGACSHSIVFNAPSICGSATAAGDASVRRVEVTRF